MKVTAECVESKECTSGGSGKKWDPDNPFTNGDDKEIPEVKPPNKPDDELTPAEKEAKKIKEEIGEPLDEKPEKPKTPKDCVA